MHILGLFLVVTGFLTALYFTGPKNNTEQNSLPPPLQGQVQALPTNTPSSNFDYEGAKAAGYSDAEIQSYLTSKSQDKNSVTPKPQVIKASDKALRLAAYIFTASDEALRKKLINQFSNGKNDLKLAVTNLALSLDSKPEALALFEKAIAQDIAQKATKNTKIDNSALLSNLGSMDINPGNINDSTDRFTKSSIDSFLPKEIKPKYPTPTQNPTINIYGNADSYTRYGNVTLGSDGSSYTQYGDTVLGSDGSSYTRYGDTILGNDGSSFTKYGNTTLGNDGSGYTQYGNTILGSDGSSYTQYGNTTLTRPGY